MNHLISYRPLIYNETGRLASIAYNLDPFIDHSIRREPDFEHPFPGVSSLCRKGLVAPHLKVGDKVVYVTIMGNHYSALNKKHRCLVAVMDVIHVFNNHKNAAMWYQQKGLNIPSNCIVKNNSPLDSKYSAIKSSEARGSEAEYLSRVRENPVYVICKPEKGFPNLRKPSFLFKKDFIQVSGYNPLLRNRKIISNLDLQELIKAAHPVLY